MDYIPLRPTALIKVIPRSFLYKNRRGPGLLRCQKWDLFYGFTEAFYDKVARETGEEPTGLGARIASEKDAIDRLEELFGL